MKEQEHFNLLKKYNRQQLTVADIPEIEQLIKSLDAADNLEFSQIIFWEQVRNELLKNQ